MARWVLHVDLDQFIAAVELLRRPELRDRPLVVGGDGDPTKRSVVATASYRAREFGIGSGMPMRVAARRCPEAVFLPVDKPAYEAASSVVMQTLREFDAVVEVVGWDEAFLGVVTDDPEHLARRVQHRVLERTRLSCSVGIGQNKLQAKLATGFGKPAGVFRITHADWDALLGDRGTDALWGIGGRTAAKLTELGIGTVRELGAADPDRLATRFGPTIGPWLVRLGRGQDRSPVVGDPWRAKSRSRETTFQQDLTDAGRLRAEVERLAGLVAQDVATEGRPAVRVVVKVRTSGFVTRTHGVALPAAGSAGEELALAAVAALDRFELDRPVRLLGVRAELADPPSGSTLPAPPTVDPRAGNAPSG
jgi:nucleotidyltransferase/DNA polymerase involved in DNA repair